MKKNIAIIAILAIIFTTASVASTELGLDPSTEQKTTLAPSPAIQQPSEPATSNALPSQSTPPEKPLHPFREWLARVTFKAVCKVIGFTPPLRSSL